VLNLVVPCWVWYKFDIADVYNFCRPKRVISRLCKACLVNSFRGRRAYLEFSSDVLHPTGT
jgi:hypothetical protein